jgi:hypothetical protein
LVSRQAPNSQVIALWAFKKGGFELEWILGVMWEMVCDRNYVI